MSKNDETSIRYVKSGHYEKIAESTAGYVGNDETMSKLPRSGRAYVTSTVSGSIAEREQVMMQINQRLRGRYDIGGRSASGKSPLKTA